MAGADRYELWVNAPDHERVIHQTGLTKTSFTPSTGLEEGSYTAWVRAYSGGSTLSSWSEAFSFDVEQGTLSSTAAVTDPIGVTTNNTVPTIAWRPTGGTDYRVTVTNVDTATTVIDEDGVTGTSYTVAQGLPPGTYQSSVFVNGLTGNIPAIAFVSPTFRIEQVTNQAQLTVPSGNSENPLPVFGWTSVFGATRYELWVDDVSNNVSRVIHSSSLTGTSLTAPSPLRPGNYRAWVRAFNESTVIGTWSDQVDFRVTEASGVPTIWSPINTTLNTVPTFAWSSVIGAQSYSLRVAGDGANVLDISNVTNNFYALDHALEPGTYTVTVSVNDGGANSSDVRTFTIGTSDGSISLFAPSGNTANTRPTFSWPAVDGATRYFVWVNDITRSINGTILDSEVKETAYTPDSALLPGDYRVWVRAFSGSTPVSSWSAANTFTITDSTGSPTITAPLYQTTATVPTITWTAVAGSAGYDIEIYQGGPTILPSALTDSATGLQTTAYRPPLALGPGTWVVRVRSVDGSGTPSEWSEAGFFNVTATANAVLVNPLADSSTSGTTAFFAWTAAQGAQAYELWVNHLDTNTVQAIHETTLTGLSFTPGSVLATGKYRAWVRAIGSGNTPGVWSPGVEFEITATDDTETLENNSQLSLLASLNVDRRLSDDQKNEPVQSPETRISQSMPADEVSRPAVMAERPPEESPTLNNSDHIDLTEPGLLDIVLSAVDEMLS